jgi:hypothetical protein
MRPVLISLAAAAAMLSNPVTAMTVTRIDVTHDNAKYNVVFEVLVSAPNRNVRRLMTDYAHLDRLSKTIIENRILAKDKNKQRIYLAMRACVLFFCKTIKKVVDAKELENGDIITTAIPQLSDFHYAVERWQILDEHDQTRIRYWAELSPSFFVPPLIGPLVVKSKIRSELKTSATLLETLGGS